MREISVKWEATCPRCGKTLESGSLAMYEKSMGLFCVGCEPKTVEEIREYRLAKSSIRADKYEEWAEKREDRAESQLNSFPTIRHDWAFITQPGRIPFRERMNRADDRAYESLSVARGFRGKAAALRNVRVAGDAERRRQTEREALDAVIFKGSLVRDFALGEGEVVQVYKKSYRVKFASGNIYARDKTFVRPIIAKGATADKEGL